jgi:hypothetical protein
MSEIQSGKDLCDQFFETLKHMEGVDRSVATLLRNLYSEDKLTGSNILEGLKALKAGGKDESESQT